MIVESVAETSYAKYVEETLAASIGLARTSYCDEKRIIHGRAEGYEFEEGALINDYPISMSVPYAAGSLCSTVGDLLRWQEALIAGNTVTRDSYVRMSTSGTLENGEPTIFGYGLIVSETRGGHRMVWHNGQINGFASWLASYPDDDLHVVVLANTTSKVPYQLGARIGRTVLGLPEPTPNGGAETTEQ
jgi:CubicO group peptidase (beta-lactamase class C family)